jgi:hypothetical protein
LTGETGEDEKDGAAESSANTDDSCSWMNLKNQRKIRENAMKFKAITDMSGA